MNNRLNTKFIIILASALVVFCAGVAFVAWVAISGDAERQARIGRTAEQAGDYKEAVSRFGRSISKDPMNLQYYDDYERALLKIVPETRAEARERYGQQYLQLLARRMGVSQENPGSWERLIDAFRARAEVISPDNQNDLWRSVQEQAGQMLDNFPMDEEASAYARSIRLDAMSRRTELLKENELLDFEGDRGLFLESDSTDPVGWTGILRSKYRTARDYWSRQDERLLDQELTDPETGFDALASRMLALQVDPTPEILRLLFMRELLEEERNDEALDLLSQQALDKAMAAKEILLASEDEVEIEEAQSLIRLILLSNLVDRESSVDFCMPLIEADKLPLDVNLVIAQAYVLSKPDVANAAARKVLDADPLSVGLYSTVQGPARSEAALVLFDTEFARLSRELSEDSTKKTPDQISDLEGFRALALEAFQGDPNQAAVDLYTQGSIDMITGNMSVARSKFMEIAQSPLLRRVGMQQRFLPRFITAASVSGERGLAVNTLGDYLESVPLTQALSLRLTYASELLVLGRIDDASMQINAVLSREPDNERALSLLATLQQASGSIGTIIEGTRTEEDRAYKRITDAIQSGNLDDARELLLVMMDRSDDEIYAKMMVIVNAQLGLVEEVDKVLKEYPSIGEDPKIKQVLSLMDIEDPLDRISVSVESTYDDASTQNAMRIILLSRYAGAGLPDSPRAEALIPEEIQGVLDDFPSDSGIRRNLLTSVLARDIRVNVVNTPDALSGKVMDRLEAVEDDEVQLANLKAFLAAASGEPSTVLEITQPIIDRNIADDQTWLVQALAYRELGRKDKAIDAITEAYDRSPNNAQYIKFLSQWLVEEGERTKALEVLRSGIRSPLTRGLLLNDWLLAESNDGNMLAAMMERKAIFDADVKDGKGLILPVYDVFNAIELARLLITIPPRRSDVLDSRGRVKYSPSKWDGLTQKQRRDALADARKRLQKRAFSILDTVERSARDDRDVVMVKFARINANLLVNKADIARLSAQSIIECCDEKLTPNERVRIVDLLAQLDLDDLVDQQMQVLASDPDPSVRRAAYNSAIRLQWEGASEIAKGLAAESDSVVDRLNLVRSALIELRLDEADELIAELEQTPEYEESQTIRADLLLYDADLQAKRGQKLLAEIAAITLEIAETTAAGDDQQATILAAQQRELRSEAFEVFASAAELGDMVFKIRPSDPRALYLRHEALQNQFQLDPQPSVQADMMANARAAVDLVPTEWAATNYLVRAYLLSGNSREAMTAIDQYFRLGGLDPQARQAMLQVAVSNGTPGQAVPSLKVAMEREPMNAEWPRTIGRLLALNRDPAGASDMWWKVLELDSSQEVIETFVELEFRREEPNTKRLKEAFELDPAVTRKSPEMRAAMAAALSIDGEQRKAERIFKDAYIESRKSVDNGADQILLDRVLVYFFRLVPDEEIEDSEARLRALTDGEMGAHEYGALASRAMSQSGSRSNNIKQSIKYLTKAINQSGTEVNYRKSLMQALSTALYIDNRCNDAIEVLKELIALGDTPAATRNNLAYMMVECMDDADGALVHSTSAVQISPNESSFLDTHGFILFKLGRFDEAEKFLARSVILGPSSSNLLHLAEVCHALGQNDRALLLIEKLGNDYPRLDPEKQRQVEVLIKKMS